MSLKQSVVVWLKAARAPFLVVSFIPAMLGGAIAYYYGAFDWLHFILVTIGIVMAHSAADFIDDYFDFKNGNLGNKDQQFHDSPLINGAFTLRQVAISTIVCLLISLGIGVWLLFEIGMPVLVMTLIGLFIVLFYTSPPFRLNYRGLGETALFIAFGPMIVFGVFYVLTKSFSWEPLIASFSLGIFIMNVGLVSNTFDFNDDVKSGKKCFPVRFGQVKAVKLLKIATCLAYLSIILGIVFKLMPMFSGLSLLTLPLAIKVVKGTSLFNDVKNYTPSMTKAIALSSISGILLIVAYIVQTAIR